MKRVFPCLLSAFMLSVLSLGAESVWVEGEDASLRRNKPHRWWYDKVKTDVLSGGSWISHFSEDAPGVVGFNLAIPNSGDYTFWLRANPVKAKLSYQLDDGNWTPVDMTRGMRGRMNIATDNKPDLRFIAWIKVGMLDLTKGAHSLKFRFDSDAQHHGAIDCFCLTTDGFVPGGATKPSVSVKKNRGSGDWFRVIADTDEFSADSVIDLSHMNEPTGTYGFLKRDGDALRFEKASGPVKFWGCGYSPDDLSREEKTLAIRFLAKHGVNMIRQHTLTHAVGLLNEAGEFDPEKLDEWDWFVAELGKHGIYSTWSVNYPHYQDFIQEHEYPPELFAELEKNRKGVGKAGDMVNFMRELQDVQYKYVEALLTHVNPYTGKTYADDPTLAVLEIQNESCAFWHGALNAMRKGEMPAHAKIVRTRFFQWVKRKYGTKDTVQKAWGQWDRNDDWEKGELALMGAYHLGAKGPLYEYAGQTVRAGDFIRFLTEMQKAFYDRRENEMRDLGFKGVTVTTAWRSGGPAADAANLYCDTACDMIDRHNYFGGGAGGHVITEGEVSTDSHLSKPGSGLLGLGMLQVGRRPFCVTEWSMMPPNEFKLEAPPLMAFYGFGLQGWDASYHFGGHGNRIGDGWHNLSKYVTFTPHYLGQFPALAFAVRNGHIKEGDVVAARVLQHADLFSGVDPLKQDFTGGGHDIKTIQGKSGVPLEALAVGRVTVDFVNGENTSPELTQLWDKGGKVVRSNTGQLIWDYGREIVTLLGPKTHAVIGKAGGSSFDLEGVRISVKTDFVSIICTPLDNRDLMDSEHILITAMARDKQTGTQYSADRKRLVIVGGPPLLMEPVQATFEFRGSPVREVKALDIYGVPTGEKVDVPDNVFAIDGTYASYYYEVTR